MDGFLSFEADESKEGHPVFPMGSHDILEKIETNSFWFNSRNKLIVAMIKKYFPLAINLLEIGCGTGYVLAYLSCRLPGMHLTGAELFLSGLKYAKRRVPDAELIRLDARNLPYVDEFDIIGLFDVLEHIEADGVVLDEVYKAVRPGGGCMITVPQHEWLWSASDEIGLHKRRYTRSGLIKKVQGAGFRIVRITSFMSLILPFMVLTRFRYRIMVREKVNRDAIVKELNIQAPLNALFGGLCDLERVLLRSVSFPWGGSLLCMAAKDE